MSRPSKIERAELIAGLQAWMPRGTRVYTILRSVSRSGMSRIISPVVFLDRDSESPIYPDYEIAKLLGYSLHPNQGIQGIKVPGCGMDIIDSLSTVLYGDGKALTQVWL